jgi:hypothetical protein
MPRQRRHGHLLYHPSCWTPLARGWLFVVVSGTDTRTAYLGSASVPENTMATWPPRHPSDVLPDAFREQVPDVLQRDHAQRVRGQHFLDTRVRVVADPRMPGETGLTPRRSLAVFTVCHLHRLIDVVDVGDVGRPGCGAGGDAHGPPRTGRVEPHAPETPRRSER